MIAREEYGLMKEYRRLGYKWIARDKNGRLFVYQEIPRRYRKTWNFGGVVVNIRGEYFTSVKWEDEKPTKIDDLISDYESHQVITSERVNKAELIKEIEDILYNIGIHDYRIGERHENYDNWGIDSKNIRKILSAIEKCSLDDEKVVIPSFVAEWIEEVKGLKRNFKLEYLFDTTEMPDDVYDWLDGQVGDTDILAKAWLDGYEVEQEKLYTVQLKNGSILIKDPEFNTFQLCKASKEQIEGYEYKLTQSEIESVDPRLMQFAEEVE